MTQEIPDLDKALKQAKSIKPSEGFFIVQIDQHLVIPAKDVPKFLESIQQARKKSRYYSDPPRLTPLASDDLTITPFSRAEFEAYQVAALLNLDRDGLRTVMQATEKAAEHA